MTDRYRELPRELRVSKEAAERLANYDPEDLKHIEESRCHRSGDRTIECDTCARSSTSHATIP